MPSIHPNDVIANLPADELQLSLRAFLQPVTSLLPDVRLRTVAELIAQGIVTSQSPVVTQIARGTRYTDETVWPTCKRAYRFLGNSRFTHRTLLKGMYRVAQRAVAEQKPKYLVVAVDPVNFEKPYTHNLEGVCRVMKDTPPCLGHPKRITRGFPAITATIVNLTQPATTYANWFSYESPEFISQNREIEKAFRITRALFSGHKLRFVGDAGLDDQKVFAQIDRVRGEFVIRCCHDRDVEVYNPQRKRWECEKLFDLGATIPLSLSKRSCSPMRGRPGASGPALGGSQFDCWRPSKSCGYWSHIVLTMVTICCCLRMCPCTACPRYAKSIRIGGGVERLNRDIASIKSRDWMLKTCAWKLWNACGGCLPWSYWPPNLSAILAGLGHSQRCDGYAC